MTMWVFGYGSLIWHPGFEVEERRLARLYNYHRSFCMRSIHHRGTPENPGLVLALDEAEGQYCEGVALRVPEGDEEKVLAYLRERELISSAYLEQRVQVELADGRWVEAVTFVVDIDHVQYCGGLDKEEQARIIARATGGMGPNDEYLFNTVTHLDELGISDADLAWIARRVRVM
ncbi:gamma-glutamylcyclotransferase [Rhodalgimonas zhirmunskyi]|uniref:glutathione-specific gamma-glutamylcyclotransferase n=1 Tax=Rhodalgimonas zhirmunskyi TaxID=2964767 RepID=A0AAJ1U9Q7_9RHOB|nr:gamma-glutamylcyclotransferase [Rhodoalgimonas zhirmunskyi]MDQ2093793.1 gamma-glutamylcyclotransferase [Rhodoalgimonas zhirmunskyi]